MVLVQKFLADLTQNFKKFQLIYCKLHANELDKER
jgi:hypothetical protein